jgi:hypothetical protein
MLNEKVFYSNLSQQWPIFTQHCGKPRKSESEKSPSVTRFGPGDVFEYERGVQSIHPLRLINIIPIHGPPVPSRVGAEFACSLSAGDESLLTEELEQVNFHTVP